MVGVAGRCPRLGNGNGGGGDVTVRPVRVVRIGAEHQHREYRRYPGRADNVAHSVAAPPRGLLKQNIRSRGEFR